LADARLLDYKGDDKNGRFTGIIGFIVYIEPFLFYVFIRHVSHESMKKKFIGVQKVRQMFIKVLYHCGFWAWFQKNPATVEDTVMAIALAKTMYIQCQ